MASRTLSRYPQQPKVSVAKSEESWDILKVDISVDISIVVEGSQTGCDLFHYDNK